MEFEHFGINVPDSTAMANWYVEHCSMRIVRSMDSAPYTHFLADETGRVVIEIYSNPADPIPEHSAQHPLRFHFAFAVPDPTAVKEKLTAAGASVFEEQRFDDGTHLVMMRDPWGVPLQLCKRGTPLISQS
ncbi:MAG TPA: VOC family protein [Phycisphaerales bacterium]|nr:VOC family protein [Phycisphaerales bacterium]